MGLGREASALLGKCSGLFFSLPALLLKETIQTVLGAVHGSAVLDRKVWPALSVGIILSYDV